MTSQQIMQLGTDLIRARRGLSAAEIAAMNDVVGYLFTLARVEEAVLQEPGTPYFSEIIQDEIDAMGFVEEDDADA